MNMHKLFLTSFFFISSLVLASETRQASYHVIPFIVASCLDNQKLIPVLHYYHGCNRPMKQNVLIIPREQGHACRLNPIELYVPSQWQKHRYAYSTMCPFKHFSVLHPNQIYLIRQ